MPTITQEDFAIDDSIEAKRVIIREALDDIAREVGSRLQEAGLNVPIFFSVPEHAGKAILSFATPVDPSESDWLIVSAIVYEIAGKRLDGTKSRGHDLRSAMAMPGSSISVAEVTAD
jgi:hypothetical protein